MNSNGNTKDHLIKKQQMYIRQLEEQLPVYEKRQSSGTFMIKRKGGLYTLHFPAQ